MADSKELGSSLGLITMVEFADHVVTVAEVESGHTRRLSECVELCTSETRRQAITVMTCTAPGGTEESQQAQDESDFYCRL